MKSNPKTHDALFTCWRKPVSDSCWIGYDSKHGKQFLYYDVIKIKSEKSADPTIRGLMAVAAYNQGPEPVKKWLHYISKKFSGFKARPGNG